MEGVFVKTYPPNHYNKLHIYLLKYRLLKHFLLTNNLRKRTH